MKLYPSVWRGLALLACLFLAAACSTVESRRQERPAAFGALTQEQQKAVLKGGIVEGLSHDAVYIALGQPMRTSHAVWQGKQVESWVYGRIEMYTVPAWRYVGYTCRDGRTVVEPEYFPQTESRIRESLVIFFRDDKVVGWQQL